MSLQPGRPAETYAEVESALLSRWPESRLDPTLDRIQEFTDYLGEPQQAYPVLHLTGTNGKTSTARMIEQLLIELGLRTGRFTSPHLQSMTERIVIDGEPVSVETFVSVFNDVAPYTHLVDANQSHPLSFFETMVGMAYAAFADAPVDAAVVEVGMGGAWDATNVVQAKVAVLTPIGMDHAQYLGDTPAKIAAEKVGIIKPGSVVVSAAQLDEVLPVIQTQVAELGADLVLEGQDFAVLSRATAVGGQVLTIRGLKGDYPEIFLPLYGTHQAQNAAVALAAVESFIGGSEPLHLETIQTAFSKVTSPGRLEVVRRSPTIILDAAHNPHGAAATVAAIEESFTFSPLFGVVSVFVDKDVAGLLRAYEPIIAKIICTQNSSPRAMSATALAELASEIFGADRVISAPDLATGIATAFELADRGGDFGEGIGAAGILVTGSVVTVGEARTLLGGDLN